MSLDILLGQDNNRFLTLPSTGRQPSPTLGRPSVLLTTYQSIIDTDHARVGQWMYEHGTGPYRDGATCIGLERHGQLVAGTMYDSCNGASIMASIAIAGQITREWLWFIFYYPFVQLGVRVILALIAHDNLRSRHLVKRFGFTEILDIAETHPTGSLILCRLYKSDCRFLTRRPS